MEPFTFASSSQLTLPVAIKVWVHPNAAQHTANTTTDISQQPP